MALIMTNSVIAGNLEKPVLEHRALIQTETNSAIDPLVIVKTEDGGFLIAGSIGKFGGELGGAIRTDTQGKILWRYTTDLREKPAVPSMAPEYRGIVPMPDGSAWLCGNMPYNSSTYPKGLLTHLDVKGRALDEQLLSPIEPGIVYLDGCTRWGDDLAIIGHVLRFDKKKPLPGELPQQPSTWYWLIVLDKTGKVKWQKEISTRGFEPAGIEGTVVLSAGPNLLFSMTSNTHPDSELVSINVKGEVQAQKKLDGYFVLIRPVRPDGLLQVFGHLPNNGPHVIITFDERLTEIQTVQGGHPSNFLTRLVYRLPDRSYVIFGSSVHTFGEDYKSAVVHVDSALANERAIDLDGDGLSDKGSIWAAAPAYQPNEFITARSFFKLDKGNNAPSSPGGLLPFERGAHGAVLDFIKLN